jgi:hypothetical protein
MPVIFSNSWKKNALTTMERAILLGISVSEDSFILVELGRIFFLMIPDCLLLSTNIYYLWSPLYHVNNSRHTVQKLYFKTNFLWTRKGHLSRDIRLEWISMPSGEISNRSWQRNRGFYPVTFWLSAA